MSFKNEYKSLVDEMNPTVDFEERLLKSEEISYSKWNKRKVAVVFAVAVMLMGTTVYATGRQIYEYVSQKTIGSESNEYLDLKKKLDDMGIGVSIPNQFESGYAFLKVEDYSTEILDESQMPIDEAGGISIEYWKEYELPIYLNIQKIFDGEAEIGEDTLQSKKIEGKEVFFDSYHIKVVPKDYELTEEDEENINNSKFYILPVTDKTVEIPGGKIENISEMQVSGITFTDGIYLYDFLGADVNLTAEQWFEIAEEILEK